MIPIVDLHADIPWDIAHQRTSYSILDRFHLSKLKRGGIKGFNAIIWVESRYKPGEALSRGLFILDSTLEDLKETKNFQLAKNSREFEKIFESKDKIAVLLGVEGGELIEDKISHLRVFYNLGVRTFGFVWNERNLLADGYREINTRSGGSGLSEFGKKVVEECNRIGILVDGAHITPNGLSDIIEFSKKPIMVSHGSTNAHNGTLRPLSDEHLKSIAKNGGVAGIFAINVKNSMPTLESYLDHIEYAVKVAGLDHVSFGFDFCEYITGDLLPASEATPIKGLEDTRFTQRVIKGLKERGFKGEEIQKIASENYLRVLKEAGV